MTEPDIGRKRKLAHCHPDREHYCLGMCRQCYEKHLRKVNPGFADRQRANAREWAALNTERKRRIDAAFHRMQKKIGASKLRVRAADLAKFGLTLDDEKKIIELQGGACAICGGMTGRGFFDLDHDHNTGEPRGFLCSKCNKGIGLIGDSLSAIDKARAYLESTPVAKYKKTSNGNAENDRPAT